MAGHIMGAMAQKDELGRFGEAYARRWLAQRGWRIVDTNWRCRFGEVDVVARRGRDLVFFEVKTRFSLRFGHPIEAISAAKMRRMRSVAGEWLRAHPDERGRVRLDVIGILLERGRAEVEHVEAVG